jgi:hypothetical protein
LNLLAGRHSAAQENIMKRLITAAAVLVLATSVAGAASMKHKSSASAGKCWDAASNVVKDKATQARSGQKKAGAVTTGSGTSGNAVNSTGGQLQTRPSGMPDC